MKVLIFGADGMLGHRLLIDLHNSGLETAGTVRKDGAYSYNGKFDIEKYQIFYGIDATDLDSMERCISNFRPDYIVNCIGYIKQRGFNDIATMIYLNSELPHHLSKICQDRNIRLLLISTDCVFSGDKGNYKEDDAMDARDIYGISKYIGEVGNSNVLTLRTSIIGHEIFSSDSLLEWFLKQNGSIKGFKRAIFSGITTNEMAEIIYNIIHNNSFRGGVYHVSSSPISKYDLLNKIKILYKTSTEIHGDYDFKCDRSLNSDRFRKDFDYKAKSWDDMLTQMAEKGEKYE